MGTTCTCRSGQLSAGGPAVAALPHFCVAYGRKPCCQVCRTVSCVDTSSFLMLMSPHSACLLSQSPPSSPQGLQPSHPSPPPPLASCLRKMPLPLRLCLKTRVASCHLTYAGVGQEEGPWAGVTTAGGRLTWDTPEPGPKSMCPAQSFISLWQAVSPYQEGEGGDLVVAKVSS